MAWYERLFSNVKFWARAFYERFSSIILGVVAALATFAIVLGVVANNRSLDALRNSATIAQQQAAAAKVVAGVAHAQVRENTDRIAFDRKLLCKGFELIVHAGTNTKSSPEGLAIYSWAANSAELLKCPS